ncbi:MAG TPA: GNAT family N-acetyltransferase [Chloroflexia bacterium]
MRSLEHQAAIDWQVRAYRPGDERQLVTLYAEVFGRPRSIEAWRWKLMGRAGSPENVWVAVTGEGRIVGQYGGIPLQMKLRGEIHPAVHAVEAMTSPDYRRQGMLTSLGSAAHDAWGRSGRVMVIGLPNEQWGTRNRALGYTDLFPLGWLRFPLHMERVATRPGKLPGPLARPAAALGGAGSRAWRSLSRSNMRRKMAGVSLSMQEITSTSADFDRLWASLSPMYDNCIVRDSSWVGWRFIATEGYKYRVLLARSEGEPVGYIAYRLAESAERSTGYVADIFVGPGGQAVTAKLLEAALDDLSSRGAGTVMATAAPGSALHEHLRSMGFLPARASTAFMFEIVPLQPGVEPGTLADPRTWHITAGDFDVV